MLLQFLKGGNINGLERHDSSTEEGMAILLKKNGEKEIISSGKMRPFLQNDFIHLILIDSIII